MSGIYVIRTENIGEQFRGSFYYLRARRKLKKGFFIDGQLRLRDNFSNTWYRSEVGLLYRKKWGEDKQYSMTLRTAYFNERNHLYFGDVEGLRLNHYWRFRALLKYTLNAANDLYFSAEPFVRINNLFPEWRRTSYIVGWDYEFLRNNIFNVEYMFQQNFNSSRLFSLAIGYEHLIPYLSKKKRKKMKELKGSIKDFRDR